MDESMLPFGPASPEAAISMAKPRRHRHVYDVPVAVEEQVYGFWSCRCGAIQDPAASRRGKSSDRLGKDNERRIERVYGPRKVGEYGDAIDLIGRDFMWQAKASRSLPPIWLSQVEAPIETDADLGINSAATAMMPLLRGKMPLIIRSYVRVGVATRDWIWVPTPGWAALYGGGWSAPWRVMSGTAFLEQHGRDEP